MKVTSIVIACVAAILPNASVVDATKFSRRRRTLKNNNDEKKNERTVDDRLKHTNNLRTSRVSHLRMLEKEEEEGSISMPSIVQASMPIGEAEFSMPSIEEAEMSVSIAIIEAEFSMPSIEEAEMSVSIAIEEAEISMPVEVEPPTFPPVPFLVPLGWSNDGLGLEIPEEEEPDMSMSVPIAEFSMPSRRRLTESMPLVEADFSMPEEVDEGPKSKSRKLGNFNRRSLEEGSVPLVEADFSMPSRRRRLTESMPLMEADFSMPEEVDEGPKSKSRKLRRKEQFVRRFLEEGSVPLEAAEFHGPDGPIFGGKTRKLAAR